MSKSEKHKGVRKGFSQRGFLQGAAIGVTTVSSTHLLASEKSTATNDGSYPTTNTPSTRLKTPMKRVSGEKGASDSRFEPVSWEVSDTMAYKNAELSMVADSLSAMKYAKVKVLRNKASLAVNYQIEGDFPKYGNNDDRINSVAVHLMTKFMNEVRKNKTYRNAVPTQSVLTITSNVVYGKKTGNISHGRKAGEPFAPGANPMHGRDTKGALASLVSVAKLPYQHTQDGISNTFSIVPSALGKTEDI
ncbi:hypothetical protein NUACC26_089820 [Scytonema sp. NUACC26]